MSVQEQIRKALRTAIDSSGGFASVMYGPLDDGNSIVLVPAGGGTEETTLAHGGQYSMDMALNAKHTSQLTARETLQLIHESLNKLSVYPIGSHWAVTGISTLSAPAYVDRNETYWIYGSALTIQYVID